MTLPVFVLTAPRPGGIDYLSGLLRALSTERDIQVEVVIGTPETEPPPWFEWAKAPTIRRAGYGFLKLLGRAAQSSAEHVALLEDDSVPVWDWLGQLPSLISTVAERFPNWWLSLFSQLDKTNPMARDLPWFEPRLDEFDSTVASIVPTRLLHRIAANLQRILESDPRWEYQRVMPRVFRPLGIHFIDVTRSLFEHRGGASAMFWTHNPGRASVLAGKPMDLS